MWHAPGDRKLTTFRSHATGRGSVQGLVDHKAKVSAHFIPSAKKQRCRTGQGGLTAASCRGTTGQTARRFVPYCPPAPASPIARSAADSSGGQWQGASHGGRGAFCGWFDCVARSERTWRAACAPRPCWRWIWHAQARRPPAASRCYRLHFAGPRGAATQQLHDQTSPIARRRDLGE